MRLQRLQHSQLRDATWQAAQRVAGHVQRTERLQVAHVWRGEVRGDSWGTGCRSVLLRNDFVEGASVVIGRARALQLENGRDHNGISDLVLVRWLCVGSASCALCRTR